MYAETNVCIPFYICKCIPKQMYTDTCQTLMSPKFSARSAVSGMLVQKNVVVIKAVWSATCLIPRELENNVSSAG